MARALHPAETVLNHLRAELLADVEDLDLNADTDLLVSGLLDSLGVMRLVGFLETEFDVSVAPEDVTIEHFQCVETIVKYLDKHQQNG